MCYTNLSLAADAFLHVNMVGVAVQQTKMSVQGILEIRAPL